MPPLFVLDATRMELACVLNVGQPFVVPFDFDSGAVGRSSPISLVRPHPVVVDGRAHDRSNDSEIGKGAEGQEDRMVPEVVGIIVSDYFKVQEPA